MTQTQRRIFMFSFIFLFLIIAPIIVFYARGYRFDRLRNIFVYSGSITIKSWPRDINVYIDDKKQDKGTLSVVNGSYTINSVRPGKHTIKCQKNGYTSWEKNIEVHSGVSTEFWNVLLFPLSENQAAQSHSDKQFEQYFLSPRNENEIVFFSSEDNKNKVYFLNIEDNKPQEVYSTEDFDFLSPAEEENVEWSSDNKKILIPFRDKKTNEKIYIVASIKNDRIAETVNLNQLFKKSFEEENQASPENLLFEKVRWMFDKNEELIILTKNQQLYYFFLDSTKEKIMLDENIGGFNLASNQIYYCQSPNKIVWEIKNNDITTKKQIISQSIGTDSGSGFVKMIAYDQYRIAIIDDKNNLIVYNEEKETGEKSLEKIRDGVKNVQFSNDGKKLLYWTSNEIWLLMLRDWEVQPLRKKNQNLLITRFSQPIENVQWMDDYENIIFSVDKTVKSAEIDIRDRANITDIKTLDNAVENRQMFYDKQNQILFFLDKNILNSFRVVDQGGIFGF